MPHTPTPKHQWILEEIPYETGDPAGGWYLHFDHGEGDDSLYMSKAHVTPRRAKFIARACNAHYFLTGQLQTGIESMREALRQAASGDFDNVHAILSGVIAGNERALTKAEKGV